MQQLELIENMYYNVGKLTLNIHTLQHSMQSAYFINIKQTFANDLKPR